MTFGPGRFEYWLIKLDEVLIQAAATENPALFIYKNNARTYLFMLEGLSKLYAGLHNRKRFQEIQDLFKTLEDALGAVDYYDNFAKEFTADPEIPATVTMYTEEKTKEKIAEVNALLQKKKWLRIKDSRTKKIRKELKGADWLEPADEIELIRNFYEVSVSAINDFYAETGAAFTDVESQIHGLRRKLRWLSIYPAALQGAVQLTDSKPNDEAVTKYLTPEIVNSPFNKLPDPGKNKDILFLEKNYFLALSWIISALGKLKDSGLKVLATAEAIKATQFVSEDVALERAYQLNKQNEKGLSVIMDEAYKISSAFFAEKNLEKMREIA